MTVHSCRQQMVISIKSKDDTFMTARYNWSSYPQHVTLAYISKY